MSKTNSTDGEDDIETESETGSVPRSVNLLEEDEKTVDGTVGMHQSGCNGNTFPPGTKMASSSAISKLNSTLNTNRSLREKIKKKEDDKKEDKEKHKKELSDLKEAMKGKYREMQDQMEEKYGQLKSKYLEATKTISSQS